MKKLILYLGLALLLLFVPLVSASIFVNITDSYTTSPMQNYSIIVSQGNNTLPYNNADYLTAWYQFNANNQTAPDFSGNGNTGTLNGWTFTDGRLVGNSAISNSSLLLADSAADLTLGSNTSLNLTSGIPATILVNGFYLNTSLSSLNTSNTTAVLASQQRIGIEITFSSPDWFVRSVVRNTTANAGTPKTAATILQDGLTYNFALTYNGTNLSMYVNGMIASSTTVAINNIPAFTTDIRTSSVVTGNINRASRRYGDIRIWNASLNNSEILLENNSQLPYRGSNLLASYGFDSNFTNATGNYTYDTNNLVAGQINGSFNFDGISKYVSIPITTFNNISQSISFSAWVYTPSAVNQYIATREPQTRESWAIYKKADNTLEVQLSNDSVNRQFFSTSKAMNLSSWTMVSFTYNNVTKQVSLYLNGVNVTQSSTDIYAFNVLRTDTSNPISIGRRNGGSYFNGSIDDVRIYNQSLSASQVMQLYNAGAYRIYNYSTINGTLNLPLSEAGSINMSFTSNANGGYYQLWAIDHNTALNFISNMSQSTNFFNATQKITGLPATGINFSTQYLTNTTHYMYVQPYNVTANGGGWYNSTFSYTPVALVSAVYTQSGVYDWLYNATAKDFYTNTTLLNFNVTICNVQYSFCETNTTTNGTVSFGLLKSLVYNITVNASDNGGYYSYTYTNVNLTSNNLVATPIQSVNTFTALQKITNMTLAATFNTTYLTNATHYMRAGSYNLSAVIPGYATQTIVYNATALSVGSYVFTGNYDYLLNLSAGFVYFSGGAPVQYTIENAQYGFSETVITSSSASIGLVTSILYNVSINSTYSTGAVSIFIPNINVSNGLVIG